MEQESRAIGPADEPFPVAVRLLEPPPAKSALKRLRSGVPDDRGVRFDGPYGLTGCMPGEEPAEVLDVGEFRHGMECARRGRRPSGRSESLKCRPLVECH